MTDILKAICDKKLSHIRDMKNLHSLASLEKRASAASVPRGFVTALDKKRQSGDYGFICEIKKASPSKGLIRPNDFDPASLAAAYERGGAACLSVLTDEPYFQGKDEYLVAARKAVSIPVLRKDFMLDPYQVVEARALGADAILIIMAALSDTQAAEIESCANEWGMDALIEVHNAEELERSLRLKSCLIGVNNRNLKTMEVRLDTTLGLVPTLPDGKIAVAESGLKTADDLAQCEAVGAGCFLIGETFMRQTDVEAAVQSLQKKAL